MRIHVLRDLQAALPSRLAFDTYDDRESPWLLSRLMPETVRVVDLRNSPVGRLLERPLVRPVVAVSGGTLRQRDLAAVADAARGLEHTDVSNAGWAGLEAAFQKSWQDYVLSFTTWEDQLYWSAMQNSRRGGTLVVQLGFPSDHAALLGQYLPRGARTKYESRYHPVRAQGRPTLAWARVDVDPASGSALIEEVQSDWLRLVGRQTRHLASKEPRSRALRQHQIYEAQLVARYAKRWPSVMLHATLSVLVGHLGIREIWMHTAQMGVVLKGIPGRAPPRSLYTNLPKSFCFSQVSAAPDFLTKGRSRDGLPRARARALSMALRLGKPVFWRLVL